MNLSTLVFICVTSCADRLRLLVFVSFKHANLLFFACKAPSISLLVQNRDFSVFVISDESNMSWLRTALWSWQHSITNAIISLILGSRNFSLDSDLVSCRLREGCWQSQQGVYSKLCPSIAFSEPCCAKAPFCSNFQICPIGVTRQLSSRSRCPHGIGLYTNLAKFSCHVM